jgi:hypothetical protein
MNLVAKDDWRGFIALVMPMSSGLIDPSVVQTHRINSVLTTPFGEPAHMVAKTETAAAFVTADVQHSPGSGTRLDQLQHLRPGLAGTTLAIKQLQDGAGGGRHIALLCREAGFGVETGDPLVQGQTVIRSGSGRRGAQRIEHSRGTPQRFHPGLHGRKHVTTKTEEGARSRDSPEWPQSRHPLMASRTTIQEKAIEMEAALTGNIARSKAVLTEGSINSWHKAKERH